MTNLIYKEEAFKIVGACMDVHNILGRGLKEVVYKDALEHEFSLLNIEFEREKKFIVNYKEIVLPHFFYADFVVMNKIILEIKACESIVEDHIKQTLNYIAIAKFRLGLIINFGSKSLQYRRVVL